MQVDAKELLRVIREEEREKLLKIIKDKLNEIRDGSLGVSDAIEQIQDRNALDGEVYENLDQIDAAVKAIRQLLSKES